MVRSPERKIPRTTAIPKMGDIPTEQYVAHRHPLTVTAVVGSFAMAVGLVLRVSGLLVDREKALLVSYQEAGFPLEASGQPWWAILVLLVLTYGLAFVLLEVPGLARRVLLAATFLVLVAAASPVVALWGVFWSPMVALLCAGWSAFCSAMWARQHPMPCEIVGLPGDGKVISISKEQGRRTG